ncbi:MAG: SEC-C metal-binding domain-containing protein [Candidatus Binatia bacterium]
MVPPKPHDHGPDCDHDHEPGPAQEPVRRAEPKVGRNDPCPCGSGKKFKKCHALVAATPAAPDTTDNG